MGKKKRNQPDLDEILQRPWCYYCERDFDDLKILINHQKAKHFKCDRCGRRLNTAGGLSVHMTQVHKESLTTIENALPNRAGLEVEIFGMEGIPEDVVIAHRQRVATQFVQAGNQPMQHNVNPAAGGSGPNPAKKPKLEGGSDLKRRLAEHKARKAAEEEAAANGGSPAIETHVSQQPSYGPPPGFTPPQFASPFSVPPGQSGPIPIASPGYNGYPPPYGQPPAPFQAQPTFGSPPVPYGHQPFQPPPFQAPPSAYAPPSQYQTEPSSLPPRVLDANSPHVQYPISSSTIPPSMSQVPRPNSLPAAPGLPQRPAFGAPTVNAFQLQQMHQGHIPNQLPPHLETAKPMNGAPVSQPTNGPSIAAAVSSPQVVAPVAELTIKDTPNPADSTTEKKAKKEKDKDIKLVYSDNDVSPEEKLAKLARYAFDPSLKVEATIGIATA